jgi:hypothetical protein
VEQGAELVTHSRSRVRYLVSTCGICKEALALVYTPHEGLVGLQHCAHVDEAMSLRDAA